jgi:hypothetical protein
MFERSQLKGPRKTGAFMSVQEVGNNVEKKLNLDLKESEAQDIVRVHTQFIREIERRGISVLPTTVRSDRIGDRVKLTFIQKRVPEERLVERVFSGGKKEDVATLFSQMLAMTAGYHSIQETATRVKFDPTPNNYALIDGRITLIDTFPPLLSEKGEIRPAIAFKLLSQGRKRIEYRQPFRIFSKFFDTITLLNRKRLAKRTLKNGFGTPERTYSSLLAGAIKERPEMAPLFIEKIKDHLQSTYGDGAPKLTKIVLGRAIRLQRPKIIKRILRK